MPGAWLQDMLTDVQQSALQDALEGYPNLAKAITSAQGWSCT